MKRKSEEAVPIGMSPEAWAKYRRSEVVSRFGTSADKAKTIMQQPLTGSNQIPVSGAREKLWQSRKSNEEVDDPMHAVKESVRKKTSTEMRCGKSSNNETTSCRSTVNQVLSGSNQIPVSGIRQELLQTSHNIDDIQDQ